MQSVIIGLKDIEDSAIRTIEDMLWRGEIDWLDDYDLEEVQTFSPIEMVEFANENFDHVIDYVVGDGSYWKEEYGFEPKEVARVLKRRKSRILKEFHRRIGK